MPPHHLRVQPFTSLQAAASAPHPSSASSATGSRPPVGSSYSRSNTLLAQVEITPRRPVPLPQKPRLQYRGMLSGAATLAEGVSSDKPSLMAEGTPHPPPPAISKADAAFAESDGVAFVWGTDGLDLEELNDLFKKVGFTRRDPVRLASALVHTHRTLWIRATRRSRQAREGQLLGFARATSDLALSATIWDVAVNPAWQRSGLGRGLVERLTASLVQDGISTITLYAEPGVVGLYEKLGFVKDPAGIKGLAFQPKSKLGRQLAGLTGIA